MILDVGPLLRGEKNRITFDYTLAPIPMDRVQFKDDAHVTGEITDSAGYMQLKAEAHLAYETECDRCLDELDMPVDVEIKLSVKYGMEENSEEPQPGGVIHFVGDGLLQQTSGRAARQLEKNQAKVDAEPAQKSRLVSGSGKVQKIGHGQSLHHVRQGQRNDEQAQRRHGPQVLSG